MRLNRDGRQETVVMWGERCFGKEHMEDVEVRAARFMEEAAELCQAAGLDIAHARRAFEHAYSRPKGHVVQEAGGVGVTLMALCYALGLSAEACEEQEVERCLASSTESFAERNKQKIKLVDAP